MNQTTEAISRNQTIIRTSIIGILANVFLAAFKAVIGLISGSIAITLDAVNNISDAGSSIITIIGTKLAGKAPDKKHPWGHGRVEYLSSMIIAVIILYAGITSFVESVKKILQPETPSYTTVMLIIVAVAILVKLLLGRYVKHVGETVNSESLVNSGTDALMDSLISTSTLVAAIIFILTNVSLEAWLGAIIAVVIIKSGFDMIRETISEILGERIGAETAVRVNKCIAELPEVFGVYDVMFHEYGPDRLYCSAHVEVPDTMTAREIDVLQRKATAKLYQEEGIILTAMSIYSKNTQDPVAARIEKDIYDTVIKHEHVLQVHGFYISQEEHLIQFDVVISFDVPDRTALYQQILGEIQAKYPDYKVITILDTDFSLSE